MVPRGDLSVAVSILQSKKSFDRGRDDRDAPSSSTKQEDEGEDEVVKKRREDETKEMKDEKKDRRGQ